MPSNFQISSPFLLAVALVTGGCEGSSPVERADEAGESESESESMSTVEVDEDEIIAAGQRYATDLVQLSDGPEYEETHADAAAVVVWGSAHVMDDFLSIDPDDPTQALTFPVGTFFVKEHLDESDQTRGLTMMYKAESGYDPEHGDWFWARLDGTDVTDAGRVGWCSSCHSVAHNSDFVVGFGKSP